MTAHSVPPFTSIQQIMLALIAPSISIRPANVLITSSITWTFVSPAHPLPHFPSASSVQISLSSAIRPASNVHKPQTKPFVLTVSLSSLMETCASPALMFSTTSGATCAPGISGTIRFASNAQASQILITALFASITYFSTAPAHFARLLSAEINVPLV